MNGKNFQVPYDAGCKSGHREGVLVDTPGIAYKPGEVFFIMALIRGGTIWNSTRS